MDRAKCALAGSAAATLKKYREDISKTRTGRDTSQRLRRIEEAFGETLDAGKRAVTAMASCVRDDSDRAALATYYHLMVREPTATVEEQLRQVRGTPESTT